jgi:hypothetical protein
MAPCPDHPRPDNPGVMPSPLGAPLARPLLSPPPLPGRQCGGPTRRQLSLSPSTRRLQRGTLNRLCHVPHDVVNRKAAGWGGGAVARAGARTSCRWRRRPGAGPGAPALAQGDGGGPWWGSGLRAAAGQHREEHVDGQKALAATPSSLGLDCFSILFLGCFL